MNQRSIKIILLVVFLCIYLYKNFYLVEQFDLDELNRQIKLLNETISFLLTKTVNLAAAITSTSTASFSKITTSEKNYNANTRD